jgi:hypothetical protein
MTGWLPSELQPQHYRPLMSLPQQCLRVQAQLRSQRRFRRWAGLLIETVVSSAARYGLVQSFVARTILFSNYPGFLLQQSFGMFRSKYTCDDCGANVCYEHSTMRTLKGGNASNGRQRACNNCLSMRQLPGSEASSESSDKLQPVTFCDNKLAESIASCVDSDKCRGYTGNDLQFSSICPLPAAEDQTNGKRYGLSCG